MNPFIPCFLYGSLLALASQPLLADQEPIIPFSLAKGQVLFENKCSSCHGQKMMGTDKGPPLIHPFYKPSHHNDASFYRAGLKGVRAHHWDFGDMPAVPGITESRMKHVVSYIRFYQQQKKLY